MRDHQRARQNVTAQGDERKVDNTGKTYKGEWKEEYAFILPDCINSKSICVIYDKVVAICKDCNFQRHYERKHSNFKEAHPLQTEAETYSTDRWICTSVHIKPL